ncbi:MAG: filamentous hemagglutinin N-terminal domain-containing protein, partial [Methylococcales bacterium]|nr:filamentous hemagglutinin N-terminal domain-containing protein [Methylococcales bacterium]
MNKIYRIIWSEAQQAFIVVSELAKGHCKASHKNSANDENNHISSWSHLTANYRLLPFDIAKILGVSLLGLSLAYADPAPTQLPTGGEITQGSGNISQTGNTLTIQQNTEKMVGEWNSFNIGEKAAVNFKQPNADSVALNRINDSNPTEIQGKLNANGQVYLLNNNGVIFGKTAQVDVGGLVASTQKLSDENFKNGKNHFTENTKHTGRVENQGEITAHGGVVAFVAPQVSNSGTIKNEGGTVALAAGEKVSLDFNGDGLVNVKIDKAALNALAENKGLIQADGGAVIMSAKSADSIMDAVVNNDGIIQARALKNQGGRIVLDAEDGTTHDSGTLDVSSGDGKGGSITVTGDKVLVNENAHLSASGKTGGGEILIGGDYQGKNPAVHNAKTTIVDAKVEINADAKTEGKGGKVIVWSDENTKVAAKISAKGGKKSGDGGFVETSGHKLETAAIKVNASAPKGKSGEWLLDPNNVTITTGTDTNVSGNPSFTTTTDSAIITPTTIETALNAGTSVTVSTGAGGTNSQAGDINVNSNIIKTAGTDATLTLKATGNIILSASTSITASLNKLHTILWSDSDGTGDGSIQVGTGVNLTTGNLWMGGGSGTSTWNGLTVGNGYAFGNSTYLDGVYIGNTAVISASNISISGHGASSSSGVGINFGTSSLTATGLTNLNGIGGQGNNGAASGSTGGTGGSGGSGGVGIQANGATINSDQIVLMGTGGAGGAGGTGGISGYSATAGTGGVGGNGGYGISLTSSNLIAANGITETGIGANGGNGGNAGTAVSASSVTSTGGNGGFGGTGGAGGSNAGGIILSSSALTSTASTLQLTNTAGISGSGGAGSAGGQGSGWYGWSPYQAISGYDVSNNPIYYTAYSQIWVSSNADIACTYNTGCSPYYNSAGGIGSSGAATTPDFTATGGYIGYAVSGSSTANIVFNNDTMTLNSLPTVQSSGALTIAPRTIGTTIGIAGGVGTLLLPDFSIFANGFSNITIGRSDGTGKITAGAFTTNDNLTLLNSTGGMEFTGLLAAGTNTVTLNSTGAVFESGSGAITATNLSLLGTAGAYTLNGANNVVSLTANTGSVSYTDADALALGASVLTSNFNLITNGAISQSGALSVAGTTSLTAGSANAITLADAGNSFTGAVSVVSGSTVSLTNAIATVLNVFNVGGNLTLVSTGAVSQVGNISVAGTTSLTAGNANAITLANAGNSFTGAVSVVSGATVTLTNAI